MTSAVGQLVNKISTRTIATLQRKSHSREEDLAAASTTRTGREELDNQEVIEAPCK